MVRDGDTKVPTVDTRNFPNANPDYFEYRAWLAAGGVPLPAELRPAAEIAAACVWPWLQSTGAACKSSRPATR